MAQSALPWLTRFCAVYAKHTHSVRRCWAEPHANGALVSIAVPSGIVQLLIHAKDQEKFYAQTASLGVSLYGSEQDGLSPKQAEGLARQFIEVLVRADSGNLVIETVKESCGGPETTVQRIDPAQALASKERLADEIHWNSFIGYKALVTEDLYPHTNPLGELVSEHEILNGWQKTVERINQGTAPEKLGLYIHSPFCTVACTFCYCGKTDNFDRQMMEDYLSRLHAEIQTFAPIFRESTFTSVYFGGGTPSLFTPPAMRRLFADLYGTFHVPEGTQIIFEGNPDSLNDAKIKVLANEGRVSRLTIGVQTLDDDVQKVVRRFNKPSHVSEAIAMARKHGITHVNCDLMAGMPLQTLESFQRDVEYLFSLEPDSLHLNGYRPLPQTLLGSQSNPMDDEQIELRNEMIRWGTEFLANNGHTDEAGQGKRRTRNAANIQEYDLRRQNSSLLGLGYPARSHSFGGHYYMPDGQKGIDAGLQQEGSGNRLWRAVVADDTEEQHKYFVNNFRTGFHRAEFESIFRVDPYGVAPEAFDKLAACGLVTITDDRIQTHVNSPAEDLTYRTFLYSGNHMARAKQIWGGEYDRTVDYTQKLLQLTESAG
jgi:coproporphyrinogen III oxidase-like Fe-S oxidoreductase